MGNDNHFKLGDPWAICDVSGGKFRRSDMRKQWDGLLVYKDFWEPRHPQDFVYAHRDQEAIRDARPRPADDVTVPGWLLDEGSAPGVDHRILDENGISIFQE